MLTDESLMLDIDIIEKKHEQELALVIAEKDKVIAQKDAEKDKAIAEKDNTIAEKDQEILLLKKQLEKFNTQ